jgi:hypothetical protein
MAEKTCENQLGNQKTKFTKQETKLVEILNPPGV